MHQKDESNTKEAFDLHMKMGIISTIMFSVHEFKTTQERYGHNLVKVQLCNNNLKQYLFKDVKH